MFHRVYLLLWKQSQQNPNHSFSDLAIWVWHCTELFVLSNLRKELLKKGHFYHHKNTFMKRLAFASSNLIHLKCFFSLWLFYYFPLVTQWIILSNLFLKRKKQTLSNLPKVRKMAPLTCPKWVVIWLIFMSRQRLNFMTDKAATTSSKIAPRFKNLCITCSLTHMFRKRFWIF